MKKITYLITTIYMIITCSWLIYGSIMFFKEGYLYVSLFIGVSSIVILKQAFIELNKLNKVLNPNQ